MTVRELIAQLQLIENQELQVVYGHTEYDNLQYSPTYLWAIDNPKYDIKGGKQVVNLGDPSDNQVAFQFKFTEMQSG